MDKDGNKELEAGKDVTIIDTVTLEGLEVGTQYKLVGWQMSVSYTHLDVYKRQQQMCTCKPSGFPAFQPCKPHAFHKAMDLLCT